MTLDSYKRVRFEDGEGLAYVDLIDMQRYMEAKIYDQIFRELTGNFGPTITAPFDPIGSPASPDVQLAYVLAAGSCVLRQGSTGTRLKINPGTVFQSTGTPNGDDHKFLAFTVKDGDVDLTISAGHATNPRIDILQMKLEEVSDDTQTRDIEDAVTRIVSTFAIFKKTRVQATFSIKNGTAGALPVYPAPDTGYCVVGAVRVPALWSTGVATNPSATTSAQIRQLTMPMRIREVVIPAHQFDLSAGANWTISTNGELLCAGAPGTNARVWVPGGTTERLVAIGVTHHTVTSADFSLRVGRMTPASGPIAEGPQYATITDLHPAVVGNYQSRFVGLDQLQGFSSLSSVGVNGNIGDPIWAAGGPAGPATRRIEVDDGDTALGAVWTVKPYLEIDMGTGSRCSEVTFYLAG